MWLAELAARRALETPDRVAYRWLDRNSDEAEVLTYAELDRRARAVGAGITACTEARARVLVLLPSSLDFVVALFGCMYAGRTFVPGPEPRRRDAAAQARLRVLLRDSQPELVIARAELVTELMRAASLPDRTACTTLELLCAAADSGEAWPARDDNELTLLQYTSGSTSAPKGTMITESSLRANLEAISQRFEHTPASQGVSWVPLHHDMGLVGCVLEPMHTGFTSTLLSALDVGQRPIRWLRAISRYRATGSGGPAFAYRMCVERIPDNLCEGLDLSSWQVAYVAAERVSAPVLRSFVARFARCGFDERAVLPCYGLAESTLMATSRTKGSGLTVEPGANEHVSCGAPIPGHDLRIVDPESGNARPERSIGEVWLRGPSVAAGYWRKPDTSADTFQATFEGAGAYLRTGDLGFLHRGELFITGRLKETIIVRGVKHAPEDLEATVNASHPCFAHAQAAAFSRETEHGEHIVIACEVRRSASNDLELQAAKAAALEAVVRVHDVRPEAIVLVKPGVIPRTTSGKVQRNACRELFERGELATREHVASSLGVNR